MRNLLLCLLLLPLLAFAQKRKVFRIDSLPKEGILLDQGWKWHSGDNPDWAKTDFDDDQWARIDPTEDIYKQPHLDKNGAILWLRLHLTIDSSIQQPLAMLIQQSGASEIYLDGRLLHKIGIIDGGNHHHQALNPMQFPFSFQFTKTNSVVAIRYALKPNVPYSTLFGMANPIFTAKLNLAETAFAESASNLALTINRDMFRIGVYFVLFIIFFTRFLFLSSKKVSLYFSIYTLLFALSWWLVLGTRYPDITEKFYWLNLLALIIQTIGVLFLISAVYQFFEQKRSWMYWILICLAIVSIPFALVFYGWGWLIYAFIFSNFANFEIVRTSIIATLNKQKGAWIMVVAGGIYLICWIVFTLLFTHTVQVQNPKIQLILFDVSMLIMSLAFAVNLGFDFAMNYRSLQRQFEENQKLSENNQQILRNQNETLELQVSERTTELLLKNKELEIEAALERVRSRTMAMQNSNELANAAILLFQQVQVLGISVWSCGYNIFEKGEKSCLGWMSSQGILQPAFRVPLTESPTFIRFYESKQEGEDFYVEALEGKALEEHYRYMMSLPDFKEIGENFVKSGFSFPSSQVHHVVNFSHGNLIFISGQAIPESHNTLKRFAAVFDQTYIRFLDLQFKEQQATILLDEKQKLENTLKELKSTQSQLIQSEKLASLGELTAGIAHEIQNPLNFVNNFAEVSAEMLDEMHEELEKGDTTEAIAIATDLKTNLEKINHHGQRASSIVKGMLEHSRASTGVKEPTDINGLADEFLRLAYHGLRAKDNSFNATLETHFDPDLPLVSVIPQDIGRVLLNLINNAFYAVHQRATTVETLHATSLQYQPTVTVSTQKIDNQILIKVKDNGNGIPESIRDKIFQPFFTTKPTGQGTGLGLSLAYDIVTKGHGGTLEVETKENDGTEFTIILSVKTL